jgi:hypothetical protein
MNGYAGLRAFFREQASRQLRAKQVNTRSPQCGTGVLARQNAENGLEMSKQSASPRREHPSSDSRLHFVKAIFASFCADPSFVVAGRVGSPEPTGFAARS